MKKLPLTLGLMLAAGAALAVRSAQASAGLDLAGLNCLFVVMS